MCFLVFFTIIFKIIKLISFNTMIIIVIIICFCIGMRIIHYKYDSSVNFTKENKITASAFEVAHKTGHLPSTSVKCPMKCKAKKNKKINFPTKYLHNKLPNNTLKTNLNNNVWAYGFPTGMNNIRKNKINITNPQQSFPGIISDESYNGKMPHKQDSVTYYDCRRSIDSPMQKAHNTINKTTIPCDNYPGYVNDGTYIYLNDKYEKV